MRVVGSDTGLTLPSWQGSQSGLHPSHRFHRPMPRLRLFILWIVCVCVPLQGWAATAMAFCGPAYAGGSVAAALAAEPSQARPDGPADHTVHAKHGSSAPPVAGSTTVHDAGQGHDFQAHHADASQASTHADVDDGASHACGTCAACHAAALTGRFDVAVLHDLPPADLAEPALVPATRVPRVLDRPPRA